VIAKRRKDEERKVFESTRVSTEFSPGRVAVWQLRFHEPPKIELDRSPSQGSGNGGWRNLVPAGGDLRRVKSYSPPPASTGIWVGLASITMTFAAFTSALIVRQAGAGLAALHAAPVLYLNTLVIIRQQRHAGNSAPPDCGFMGGVQRRRIKIRPRIRRAGST
jgi:hypothetical protein